MSASSVDALATGLGSARLELAVVVGWEAVAEVSDGCGFQFACYR